MDRIISIWNSFDPQPWAHSIFDMYPSLFCILSFTIIHYILDTVFKYKAIECGEREAKKKLCKRTLLPKPSFLSDSLISQLLNEINQQYHTIYDKKTGPKTLANLIEQLLTKHNVVCNTAKNNTKNTNNSNTIHNNKKHTNNTAHNSQKRYIIEYMQEQVQLEKGVSKFQESLFKVTCFGLIYTFGMFILFNPNYSSFFWNVNDILCHPSNWPQSDGVDKSVLFNLNNYYWLQMGYHGHRAVYQFFEHYRKDFWIMFAHHWLTIFLIIGSYCSGYQQIGANILFCYDHSDMLYSISKFLEHFEHVSIIIKHLHTAFFVAFGVTWVPLRVVMYFFKLIPICCGISLGGVFNYEVFGNLEYGNCGRYHDVHGTRNSLFRYSLTIASCLLYAMQIYWGSLIVDPLVKYVSTGYVSKDVRSDNEGDGVGRKGGKEDKYGNKLKRK